MNTTSAQEKELKFSDLISEPTILSNLADKLGFTVPTPIQAQSIPPVLAGRHLYASARTGSGKTMAFLIPMAQMFVQKKIRKALVLSPVRELALQIDEEAMKILGEDQKENVSIPLYGGVPLDHQLRAMKAHKPNLYIATPGRMLDFIQEGEIDLAGIDVCVLDEADRMCDMGFADQVTEILDVLPNCKQFLMFSATLPKKANDIMNRFLKDPVTVQVDNPLISSSSVRHEAYFCTRNNKWQKLEGLIAEQKNRCVIFTRTRKGADGLYDRMKRSFPSSGILHAGYNMNERERTIRAFKEGKIQFLIATDVASRGIDVEEVALVIHYEIPETTEDYIHRSGRSGRAGKTGISIALVDQQSSQQKRAFEDISKKIDFEVFAGSPSPKSEARNNNRNRSKNRNRKQAASEAYKKDSKPRHKDRSKPGARKQNENKSTREPSQFPKKKTSSRSQAKDSRAKTGILSKTKSALKGLFGKKK